MPTFVVVNIEVLGVVNQDHILSPLYYEGNGLLGVNHKRRRPVRGVVDEHLVCRGHNQMAMLQTHEDHSVLEVKFIIHLV